MPRGEVGIADKIKAYEMSLGPEQQHTAHSSRDATDENLGHQSMQDA